MRWNSGDLNWNSYSRQVENRIGDRCTIRFERLKNEKKSYPFLTEQSNQNEVIEHTLLICGHQSGETCYFLETCMLVQPTQFQCSYKRLQSFSTKPDKLIQ